MLCLLQESEYAAWTLVNGYSLNHAAVSVHRLQDFKWVKPVGPHIDILTVLSKVLAFGSCLSALLLALACLYTQHHAVMHQS